MRATAGPGDCPRLDMPHGDPRRTDTDADLIAAAIAEASRRAGITERPTWRDRAEVLRLIGGGQPLDGEPYARHLLDVLGEMGLRSDGYRDSRDDDNQDNDHIALP